MIGIRNTIAASTPGLARFLRRHPSFPFVWIAALLVGWYAVDFDYRYRIFFAGSSIEERLQGRSTDLDDRHYAQLEAADLLVAMRAAVALRDTGAEDDWSEGSTAYGVRTLRHGASELPVPSVASAMGFHPLGRFVGFEVDRPPLVPLWVKDGGSYLEPKKGRLVFSVDTDNPQTCRRIVATIEGYPSVVANFEVSYPERRTQTEGDAWLPLDPARSSVMKEMCRSQFDNGDPETGRYLGSMWRNIRFRLLRPEDRSTSSDEVMDIPPP